MVLEKPLSSLYPGLSWPNILLRVWPFLLGACHGPCCRGAMGVHSLALGSWTGAAVCHPSGPLASPPALAKAAASVRLALSRVFQSSLSLPISTGLLLSNSGCFSCPSTDQLLKQQCFGVFLPESTPFQPSVREGPGPSRVREAGTLG